MGEESKTASSIYFISDLHIGGDGELNYCEFEPELISFLRNLAELPGKAELVIVGDVFGLWELTTIPTERKILFLAETHAELFNEFRRTGAKHRITFIPGNHDHELAWAPDYARQLLEYNVHLERAPSITREIAGRRIWIEHGNQYDPFNQFVKFGSPYASPFGYYVTTQVVGAAGRYAHLSKGRWLRDVESVYPNEDIPFWVISNYFYREMFPVLRWLLFPFLLLFGISAIILAGTWLEQIGFLRTHLFSRDLGNYIGFPGKIFDLIFWVNGAALVMGLELAIPIWIIARDMQRVLRIFGIDLGEDLKVVKEQPYMDAATRLFDGDPKLAVFIYGHTHIPSFRRIGDRCIINTGTWLKRLVRVKPFFALFPSVFVPSFHLNYFEIDADEAGNLRIRYRTIQKERTESDLNWMQRLAILKRSKNDLSMIPAETILSGAQNTTQYDRRTGT